MTPSKNQTDEQERKKQAKCSSCWYDHHPSKCPTTQQTPDPLGDMFEAMGIDVIDVTPKEQSDE